MNSQTSPTNYQAGEGGSAEFQFGFQVRRHGWEAIAFPTKEIALAVVCRTLPPPYLALSPTSSTLLSDVSSNLSVSTGTMVRSFEDPQFQPHLRSDHPTPPLRLATHVNRAAFEARIMSEYNDRELEGVWNHVEELETDDVGWLYSNSPAFLMSATMSVRGCPESTILFFRFVADERFRRAIASLGLPLPNVRNLE